MVTERLAHIARTTVTLIARLANMAKHLIKRATNALIWRNASAATVWQRVAVIVPMVVITNAIDVMQGIKNMAIAASKVLPQNDICYSRSSNE